MGYPMDKIIEFHRIVFDEPKSYFDWFEIVKHSVDLGIRNQIQPQFYQNKLIGVLCETPSIAVQLKLMII